MKQVLSKMTHEVPYQDGYVSWYEFGKPLSNKLPLVLLHGGHGSWEHWFHNVEGLSQHFHVLVPDMPGYGASSLFDSQLQSGVLDPLKVTMDSLLGVNQAVNIAGFSFGSFVAAHLTNQRQNIHQLALLGGAGHGGPRRPRGDLLAWRDLYANQDWGGLREVMRKNLFLHMISTDERVDDLAIRIHQDACLATRFRSRHLSRAGGLAQALEGYAGKVLMIYGEHDVTCTPEYVIEKIIEGHPRRSIELIKDAGHWVMYEKPDQVNCSLIQWFEESS